MTGITRQHAVSYVKFSLGFVCCICNWESDKVLTRTPEQTREEFAKHRREAGMTTSDRSIAYGGQGGWK